jgi:tripartite ATP-independent transporter DctM subunit
MDNITIGILAIAALLILLGLGLHIAVDFLLVGLVATAVIIGLKPALPLLGQTMYYSIATPGFAALPLFVIMGAFAARGGFAKRVYDGMHQAAWGLPGSLGITTCFGCAAFGAVSGSSLATAAIFGRLVLPEMARHKYDKTFALGTIASAGTFAAMIPPSSLFIIYAIFTEQSVGRLFIAGVIPGVITAIVYSVSIIMRVKFNPELAPAIQREARITIQQRVASLGQTWPVAILATIVLGGIYTGVFTPTEAGAAGAFSTLILGMFLGNLNQIKAIKEALRESAQTTAMVFMIIVGALFFTRVLAITRIPVELSELILGWNLPAIVVLLFILVLWFILGMIIIPAGICALTLPIVFPIIVELGYDPIWFGVITLKLAEIAAVTPPVGLNVYTLKGVAGEDTSIEEVFRGIWPFVICDLVVLVLLIAFPQLSLFLPNLMMGK